MCIQISCDQCGLTTWEGCGRHVTQVLKDVPYEERCKCRRNSTDSTTPEDNKMEGF